MIKCFHFFMIFPNNTKLNSTKNRIPNLAKKIIKMLRTMKNIFKLSLKFFQFSNNFFLLTKKKVLHKENTIQMSTHKNEKKYFLPISSISNSS